MTEQATAKGNATVTTEIWYGGPTLQRNDEQVMDDAGAIVASSETVFNGPEVWIASTGKGQTQVIHTIGTTWNAMVEDPAQQGSLTDMLARYSNDKACMDARLQGEGSVAGQAAYVIVGFICGLLHY